MLISLLTVAVVIQGGPPDGADALHDRAMAAYRRGAFHDAVEYWLLAEARQRDVRFEVNLAKSYHALYHGGAGRDDLIECFRWTEQALPHRAELKGEPPTTWVSLAQCAELLSRDRALLSLILDGREGLEPVVVTLNGRPWAPPWHTSPPEDESHLRVTSGDAVWFDGRVAHPIGVHTTKRLSAAAREAREPAPPVPQVLATEVSRPLAPWRWASLGIGLGLSAIGAGLVGHAFALSADLDDANARYVAGALDDAGYLSAYGDAEREQAAIYPAGVSLLSLGAASLVAAIVLFTIDDAGDSGATVTPAWLGAETPLGLVGSF